MAKLCVIFVLVLVVIHANAHKVPSDGGLGVYRWC
jgi:hypothetical protein